MATTDISLLHFTHFSSLGKWSAHNTVFDNVENHFPLVPLSEILTRAKEPIDIEDGTLYKRITIRLYGQGVLLRDEVLGNEIGTKRQFVAHAGQLIISRIDARNGAFGIVPSDLEGAIVTNDFWLFDVHNALPEYIMLVLSSDLFQQYWQTQSSGTTNRQRVSEDSFLASPIALPELKYQADIIKDYCDKLAKADEADDNCAQINVTLSSFLMTELGLGPVEALDSTNILNFTRYKDVLSKWEWNPLLKAINKSLSTSKYPVLTLDKAVGLVNRRWEKTSESSDIFNYIEIGGIDPESNTAKSTPVAIEKAPSRATQIVKTGDLIIGTTRPYLKKFAIIDAQQNNYVCSSGFQVVEENPNYDQAYILEVIKLDPIIKQFEYLMTGALYPAVNSEQIRQIRIPLPPIEIQKQISHNLFQLKQELFYSRKQAEDIRQLARKDFEKTVFGLT